MDALRQWFSGLAQREQRFVLGGAAACMLLAALAAWVPFERRLARLEQRVQSRQADLAWLQAVAPQLTALRAAAPAPGGESLVALADSIARSSGMARSLSSQPGGDGTLSVRLEQVPFDALLGWTGELVQHHGVRVVSANIDGSANSGVVSATFVLRGP
jgi:general secretion pathway protein M